MSIFREHPPEAVGKTLRPDLQFASSSPPAAVHQNGCNPRWYVVQAHKHSESLAERHLLLQDFRTYLPRRKRTVRHARNVRTVASAYFDCYLFVFFDMQLQRWYPINSTVGVRKLVMNDRAPIPVPHGIVESLISVTDEEGILHPDTLLSPGQRIRILDGPFSDQLGILDHVGDAGAVRILLNIMNRAVAVRVNRDSLSVLASN
jgi:transcription elongation factor/antiterminator RfaH